MSAECRSCHAAITWTTNTKSGKRMPIDPVPVANGNIVLTTGNDGPRATVLTKAELEKRHQLPGGPGDLYVSHHATCPQRDTWRR